MHGTRTGRLIATLMLLAAGVAGVLPPSPALAQGAADTASEALKKAQERVQQAMEEKKARQAQQAEEMRQKDEAERAAEAARQADSRTNGRASWTFRNAAEIVETFDPGYRGYRAHHRAVDQTVQIPATRSSLIEGPALADHLEQPPRRAAGRQTGCGRFIHC